MAKNKRKPITTEDSIVDAQEGGAGLPDKEESRNIPAVDDREENPAPAKGMDEGTVLSEEAGSSSAMGGKDGDPLDDIRRSLREEESRQGGKYSGRWWSRKRQTSRPAEDADAQASNLSTPEIPADNTSEDSVAQEEDIHESGKYSEKWWSRGVHSIRYEDPAEGHSPNAPDEEAPPAIGSTQPPAVQDGREEETGFLSNLAKKYASHGMYGVGYRHEEGGVSGIQSEARNRNLELEELKRKAFRGRILSEEEDIPEIRSIVLDGEEDAFVEDQARPRQLLETRFTAFENRLRPFKGFIFAGLAMLLLVMATIAGWLAFNIYQRLQAPEVVQEGVTLPYPVVLSLPGGLNFDLEKGTLENGEWNPQGPEWLEGTDLCRWIAIPWSPQLEAVVQTLQRNDPIGLEMSNNDRVIYKVDSIRQLSTAEMEKLESNSPCLVLVLAGAEIKTRWVVTALP